jgi:glycosyltransferase involved in cell wall biosynthesis
MTAAPTVSVIVCAYTLRRWEALREGIASIARQTQPPFETILVIDHNPELLEQARVTFPGVRVVSSDVQRGVSSSRNTAIELASGEIFAFLDDDAIADETWLEELTRSYSDPDVIGTGGMPRPRWENGRAPRWLPPEFYWTVGCGYRGLPTEVAPVRNPIGATMSFRKTVFDRIGGFSKDLGPTMATPNPHGGGEETELAIRALRAFPGGAVLHMPAAGVEHVVPADRTRWSYFRSRCWLEGQAKAWLAGTVGSTDGLTSERTYTLKTLPIGVLHGLRDAVRGDFTGLQRAGTIVAGLAITAAGYLQARLTQR